MLQATVRILGAALVRFPLNFSETGTAIFMLGGTDVLVLGSVVVGIKQPSGPIGRQAIA